MGASDRRAPHLSLQRLGSAESERQVERLLFASTRASAFLSPLLWMEDE